MKQIIAEVKVVDTKGNEIYNKRVIVDFEINNISENDLQISINLDPIRINSNDELILTFENRNVLLNELLKVDFNC
jgi:hypothetical protein